MKNNIIVWITVLICLVLPFSAITLVGLRRCGSHKQETRQGKKPDPSRCEHPDGIDLSHHNEAYDWKKVDARFVYVRATSGTTLKDRRYDIHRKAAVRHDIPVGAYHFLVADAGAEEQFRHFSSVVRKGHITLRPMLDIEESRYWNAPKDFTAGDVRRLVRRWCDLCKERYGKAPVIYITENLHRKFGMDKGFEDCLWWVANYNDVRNFENKCRIPYILHQYSDKKNVEGFYGHIDCNRFATGKDVDDLKL
ncbi:MAG: hypothetical protein NC344_02255 [Bacteroidales bacterium]|nr:hypothetical protein [Bacteroidales bacterium]MCM1146655.1 hypothetical protein [Bacteroidales bacterium]MCM1206047.1 hypothetical protein [Bacillota bacterium]MCM1511053.1 hypothetical protein [Clostridium sp.]